MLTTIKEVASTPRRQAIGLKTTNENPPTGTGVNLPN